MSQNFSPKGRSKRGELVVGRLMEHGAAPYQFDSNQGQSYFLKVLTNRGEKIFWGSLLHDALTESATQPKINDQIGIQRTGVETFAFGDRVVRRNTWIVESVKFFAERARLARRVRDDHIATREAVRARPELKSSFLSLRAAEDYAARRIADPQDRERFLEGIRSVIEGSIVKKMPLPDVRLRDRPKTENPAPPSKPPSGRSR
jgi:hypothetical protein